MPHWQLAEPRQCQSTLQQGLRQGQRQGWSQGKQKLQDQGMRQRRRTQARRLLQPPLLERTCGRMPHWQLAEPRQCQSTLQQGLWQGQRQG